MSGSDEDDWGKFIALHKYISIYVISHEIYLLWQVLCEYLCILYVNILKIYNMDIYTIVNL